MTHVMIDLETLGTTSRSAWISIGAVCFDPDTGVIDTGNAFYRNVDWDSALRGREVSGDTLKWWMRQDPAAKDAVIHAGWPIEAVLTALSEWLPEGCVVWGNGSSFDISMLEDTYHQYGVTVPWKFWNVRDVRTVVHLAQGLVERGSVPFEGTKHNALSDAIHQAKYVSAMWQALRGGANK